MTSRGVAAAARARTERRVSSSTTTVTAATAATAFSSSSSTSTSFSLYSQPRLYDAAFAFRDFDAEARFIVDAWKTYGEEEGGENNESLSSFLDVGAGTGRHGAALAKILSSSSDSLSLFALDASAEMLSAAARAAEEAGCPLKEAIRADMTRGFEVNPKVQVALCALGTLAHALPPASPSSELDPALEALRAVSAALVPGGILILELPAAGDLFDGTLLVGDAWDVPAGEWQRDGGEGEPEPGRAEKAEPQKRRIGQISKPTEKASPPSPALIVEYGSPEDEFDPVSQVLLRNVVVSEARADGSAGKEVWRETVAQRLFTPGEIRSLAREAGFRVAAELGDMELGEGEKGAPTAQEGDRYVAVLVKKK